MNFKEFMQVSKKEQESYWYAGFGLGIVLCIIVVVILVMLFVFPLQLQLRECQSKVNLNLRQSQQQSTIDIFEGIYLDGSCGVYRSKATREVSIDYYCKKKQQPARECIEWQENPVVWCHDTNNLPNNLGFWCGIYFRNGRIEQGGCEKTDTLENCENYYKQYYNVINLNCLCWSDEPCANEEAKKEEEEEESEEE